MNAVWNAMVNEVQGVFVKPVDIRLPSTRYDMGRPVGKVKAARVEKKATGAVEITVKNTDTEPRKQTKADVVRSMIRAAKEQGRSADTVVAEVIDALGMAKALAATYVKNNWDRA